MTIEEAFGAVIRRLRKERLLSQEELSTSSSLGRVFISQLERGRQQPTLVTIFELAKALNVPTSRILSEIELLLQFNSESRRTCSPDTDSTSIGWKCSREENMLGQCAELKGAETILLVDDEIQLREMLSELLSQFGYKVLLAEDGQDAVEKYFRYVDDINIILMDVMMPRKDGLMARKEIIEFNPEALVLLMSAYTTDCLGNIENTNFINKPMLPSELLKNIRKILDNAGEIRQQTS